ncbi:uncharacterized protein LOC129909048 [Episyrphus balteatus]|uniref:uncharacterized protein LOC129909048 n=1 Tax=Episyrphus balteatus TaxID=286459 RepID=UPI002485F048|nr:uncharacterized protein LOC129909048 [Episyrphus balteatus]
MPLKFCVTFHLIAWIVLFTINFTQSKAMPVPDDCVGIKNQTFYNNAQTELSIDYLDSNLRLYKLAINAPDTLFQEWDHKIRKLSTIDVKALFNDDAPVIEVFKKTLNNITEELFAITKAINYIILMHNNTNSMQQTKHYHNLSTEINGNVTLYFKNIFGYVRLNIDHIGDASRILNLKLFNPDVNEIGYEYAKSDLRVLEVTTLGQFNEILQYMKAFFDYIDEAVCPDPQ